MTQPSLFPVYYQRSSATSREAAVAALPRVSSQEARVLEALRLRPLTREEIADLTGIRLSAVCARCAALRERGLIRDSGERRLTSAGRRAEVLEVLP